MDWTVLIAIIVILVLLAGLAFFLWSSYQSLVQLSARVDEGWSEIRALLERRAEVVPILLETVRHRAAHERGVLESAERAREATRAARTPAETTTAENHMQQALRSVFAVADGYPQLHTSPAFLQLQGEIAELQDRLQTARRFYNGGVREFNAKIQVFPNSLFARRLGYTRRDFLDVADSAAIAEPPRVQF